MPPKSRIAKAPTDPPTPSPTVAPTVAETTAAADDMESPDRSEYEGIDWTRLPDLIIPQTISKRKPSWIYTYGYRCALRKDPKCIIFVCKFCHQRKGSATGRFDGRATSSAISHLKQQIPGHGFDEHGKIDREKSRSQPSIYAALTRKGVEVSQAVANEMAFQSDEFRRVAIQWLIDGNHPLREFESPAFRAMIYAANPLAEEAL